MRDTRRTRLILALLLVVALGLITIDYRGGDHSPLNGLRTAGAAVFGPVERGTAAVARPIGDTISAISGAPAAQRRIRALEQQNQRLRQQVGAGQLDKEQSKQLDSMLHLAGLGRYRVVAAQVIAMRGRQGYEETVSLDAGTHDGVKPGQTVVTGDGLVGRVTASGPSSSTVLLLTDASSSVGGRLEGSQQIGVVQGTGRNAAGGQLRFQVLDSRAALKPGQRIVTFGSHGDSPYVPGVPIGTVQRVEATPGSLTRTAVVSPFVTFTTLDVVGVVVSPPRSDPRDAVLPPKPSPSASPSATPSSSPSGSPATTPSGSPSSLANSPGSGH
ncbi:MAG TPA: rod shape-determining protein MreC [Streptosporangiaceae bacterium]